MVNVVNKIHYVLTFYFKPECCFKTINARLKPSISVPKCKLAERGFTYKIQNVSSLTSVKNDYKKYKFSLN